ncbi:MAG: phosphodiester glycosidase family protein [Defluviitaleaceae bacterium]|nr:phosphodiester glycosidase family protein [Defluviitaleaceae bacterium]
MKKNLIKRIVAATLLLATVFGNLHITEAAVHFEIRNREVIGKGITYEVINRVTTRGLLDIHILRAPLDDPFISLGLARSQTEFELKERTTALLQQTGAVGGVNGDFFDLAGNYSAAVGAGFEFDDGNLISANIYANRGSSRFGTFYIDNAGNPFIDYLTTYMQLFINGSASIRVTAVNKITGRDSSAILDRNAVTNTREIDARIPGRAKIVVERNAITRIAPPGESVDVPVNGFVVFLSEEDTERIDEFAVGMSAGFNLSMSVDHNAIQFAISGGGKILSNGATVVDNGHVAAGNQPRTAVGFSANGREVIMMVVDGRSHSVGVSHAELADLMRAHGAHNAMHLDGGGSSTMAVRRPGASEVARVNTPSDNAERRVTNALGIYIDAPIGVMTQLAVTPRNNRVFLGTGIPVNISGNDAYFNTVPMQPGRAAVSFNDGSGRFDDGFFFPGRTGDIVIDANYNNVTGRAEIRSIEIAALLPVTREIQTGVGRSTLLEFNGLSIDGETAYIHTGVNFEIHPETLGRMEGYTFIAENLGAGYIRASVGNVAAYISVISGTETRGIFDFEENRPARFIGHPTDVTGNVRYTSDRASSGSTSLELTYRFTSADHTQAANVSFDTPIALPGNPSRLSLMVYGNNSNHWLRGRLIDASGEHVIIDFARSINWTGWQRVEAQLPSGVRYPVVLDRIYVVSLENTNTATQTLFFDNLSGDVALRFEPVVIPESTIFIDRFRSIQGLNRAPANGVFQISVSGNLSHGTETAPSGYNDAVRQVTNTLNQHSSFVLHSGNDGIAGNIPGRNARYIAEYNFSLHNNVGIMQLAASSGGLISTDVTQWARFTRDLNETNADHIIIYVDRHPFNWTVRREFEMFQEVLAEAAQNGKNIFVVYEGASALALNVREGVRYIGLVDLWNEEGARNPGFRTLRFEIAGRDILYDFI